MKTWNILFIIASIAFFSCNNEQRLYRIQENSLYGFINHDGKIIIEPQYKYVSSFNDDGYACVISDIRIEKDYKNSKLPQDIRDLFNIKDSCIRITYGYINQKNELIVDTINKLYLPYSNLSHWGDRELIDFAQQFNNNQLNFRSEILYELSLCEGLYVYQDENSELFGYKHVSGNIKINAKYDWCRCFCNGVAIVDYRKEIMSSKHHTEFDLLNKDLLNSCGVIDTAGNLLVSNYARIKNYDHNGLTWASTLSFEEKSITRDWVQIDKKGNILIGPIPFQSIIDIYNNEQFPICAIDDAYRVVYTFLDNKGDFLSDFDNNKALTMDSGLYGDRCEVFDNVTRFSEGVAGVYGRVFDGSSAWYFVNKDFVSLSGPYDDLFPFSEGFAAVKEMTYLGDMVSHQGKWGFVKIESSGTAIVQAIPFTYSECGSFKDGMAYFKNRGTTFDVEGYINTEGEVVWQTKRRKN